VLAVQVEAVRAVKANFLLTHRGNYVVLTQLLEVLPARVVEVDMVVLARAVVRAVAVGVVVEALLEVGAVRVIPVAQLTQPHLTACQLRPVVHTQLV